jgi:hypothetical protein
MEVEDLMENLKIRSQGLLKLELEKELNYHLEKVRMKLQKELVEGMNLNCILMGNMVRIFIQEIQIGTNQTQDCTTIIIFLSKL